MVCIAALLLATRLAPQNEAATGQTVKQFIASLAQWGYRLSANQIDIEKGGLTARCAINSRSDKDGPPVAIGMWLYKNFSIPVQVADETVTARLKVWDSEGGSHSTIHIDHTVDDQLYIQADRGLLDDAWNRLTKLQSWLASWPPVSSHPKEKVEDRVIRSIDGYDAGYLVRHWGWEYKKAWAASSSTWLVPATVGGQDLWLRGPRAEPPLLGGHAESSFTVSAHFQLGKVANLEQAARALAKHESWAEFSVAPYPDQVDATITVDLSSGVAVSQIKQRIAEFARRVKRLQKSAN